MSQSFTNLLYHIVFSTKDRRPLITLDYHLSDFSWQRGYGAFTVSESNLHQVPRYDESRDHHQKISFRDKFFQFLKANEIEFDERYI